MLQKLVDSNNKSWHTGILSEPINVNKENENRLWWQMYWLKDLRVKKESKNKKVKFLLKVGDKVRISHLRSAFQREYDIKWSVKYLRYLKDL